MKSRRVKDVGLDLTECKQIKFHFVLHTPHTIFKLPQYEKILQKCVMDKIGKLRLFYLANRYSRSKLKMNTSDPYTLLRQAKDKCNDIVSFLFKHRGEETIEFLATAAYCNKILLLFLEECQPNESGKRQVPEVVHACTTTFYTLVRVMKFSPIFQHRKSANLRIFLFIL